MRKQLITLTILSLIIIGVFSIHCNKNLNENEVTDIQVQQVLDIVNNQEVYYDSLMMYLSLVDTAEAISRTQQLINNDASVSNALSSPEGIQILYSNGMRGGILLDPGDNPEIDSIDFQKMVNRKETRIDRGIKTIPVQKKTVFLNPHYYERKSLADKLIASYNEWFPDAGYEKPETYLNEEATIERFAYLSGIGYGIIHIYSHGMRWRDNNGDIQTVYLMTGEKTTPESIKRWYYEIRDGEIPMIRYTHKNYYFISPEFFSDFNNFNDEAPLIWGGFCYSGLGGWPDHMVNISHAGGYFCFDWSVLTVWNAYWATVALRHLSYAENLTAYSTGKFMENTPQIPKSYYYYRNVYLQYFGDNELKLIPDPPGVDVYNFPDWSMSISLNLDWVNSEGTDEDLTSWYTNIHGNRNFANSGTFDEKTFTSIWDEIYPVGSPADTIQDDGKLIVFFNSTYDTILSFSIERNLKYLVKSGSNPDAKPDLLTFQWDGVMLPIVTDSKYHKIYHISGTETCNHIMNVERANTWDNGKWEEVDSYDCNGTPVGASILSIEFNNY